MFVRSLKIFIQLFEFFHLPKIFLNSQGDSAGWEVSLDRILAGLKEKGDLEVSGWGV